MNENFNNQYSDYEKKENKETSLGLVIAMIIILIAVPVFVFTSLNKRGDNQEDNLNNDSNSVIEDNQQMDNSTDNDDSTLPSDSQQSNSNLNNDAEKEEEIEPPKTEVTTSMTCTLTQNNEYGKFAYINKYTFKNDQIYKASSQVTVTLNSSYIKNRDEIINQLRSANSSVTKFEGISDSVKRKSNGFTYTVKIDANKLSDYELAQAGYRTRNKSGVRMYAYNNGFACK